MFKSLKIIITLSILGDLFFGCSKKYSEDGKTYFLKSPINRLNGTVWNLGYYYINDADSISSLMYRYKYIDYGLYDGGHITFSPRTNQSTSVLFNSSIGGVTIQFINNYAALNINITSLNTGYYNPFFNKDIIWNINELTTQVLKISTTYNGVKYQILFNG